MSSRWDDDLFKKVVSAAKEQNSDIAAAIDGLEETPRLRVLQGINESRAEIEDAARDEFFSWKQLLQQKAADMQSVKLARAEMRPMFRFAYYGSWTLALIWLIIGTACLANIAIDYYSPLNATLQRGGWWLVAGIFITSGAIVSNWHWFRARYASQQDQAQVRMRVTLDIDGTQAKIDATKRKLEQRGAEAAARVWRKVIGERLRPSYRTSYDFAHRSTLEASVQQRQLVRTPGYADLMFMLENLSGSSIGIAGPRGAGKSTLIEWICSDKQTIRDKKKVLSVLTAAPVDYQARDFLLHLFASLCHRTIERVAPHYQRANWKRHAAPDAIAGADVWRAIFAGALVTIGLGMTLLIASVSWGVSLAYGPGAVPHYRTAPAPSRAMPAGPPSLAAALGLAPSNLFSASLLLLSVGAVALAAVRIRALRSIDQTRHRLPQSRDPSEPSGELMFRPQTRRRPFSTWLLNIRLIRWLVSTNDALTLHPSALSESELVQEAFAWLHEIKFQQSYTAGWAGTLKMPLGVEGSLTQARSLAQQQLTLPELVDAYKRFLLKIAEDYTVLVGIDELDKIESDEKAQRFLNDIKFVFGVDGVFFLVSVSENAMNQFERRGMPFRDVFDTAFDDVVRVDHLRFKQTQRLLEERILALPVQFQALCHVMSAGLPRELVRSLRDLVRTGNAGAGTGLRSLDQLAEQLVKADINTKMAAFRTSAERCAPSTHREALLLQTHRLPAAPATAKSLHDMYRALLEPIATLALQASQTEEYVPIMPLTEELATYLQFLAAVMKIFTSDLDEAKTRYAEEHGLFDELAAARRLLGVNHALARSLVDSVLADLGLVI